MELVAPSLNTTVIENKNRHQIKQQIELPMKYISN